MRIGTTSAAPGKPQHKDPESVIIIGFTEIKCTRLARLCVRGLNRICVSIPRAARFVFDAFATLRSLVVPLLAAPALTDKITGMRWVRD